MTNLSKLEPCIRAQLVLQNIIKNQKLRQDSNEWSNSIKKIMNCKLCFQKQQRPSSESIRKIVTICQEVVEDRKKHIKAIELSRAKRIYDNLQEYQTHVIEVQGKDEYKDFIGPQGTSIVKRSPRVCRIPYKSGQLFSHL